MITYKHITDRPKVKINKDDLDNARRKIKADIPLDAREMFALECASESYKFYTSAGWKK